MTQEDKDLLFKDICARLPYHVRVKVWLKDKTTEEGILDLEHNYGDVLRDAFYYKKIIDIKPYLRSMSRMMHSEYAEYLHIKMHGKPFEVIDWLNAHHFDYRRLIDKGFALEAPEGMYK